jgi:hypothetical protein
MTRLLLWFLFFNGILTVYAWWGVWPMMLVGAAQSVVAHVWLAVLETRP